MVVVVVLVSPSCRTSSRALTLRTDEKQLLSWGRKIYRYEQANGMIIAYHMFGLRGMSNDVYGRVLPRLLWAQHRSLALIFDWRHFVARRESINMNLSTTINSVEVEAHNSKRVDLDLLLCSVTATGINSERFFFLIFSSAIELNRNKFLNISFIHRTWNWNFSYRFSCERSLISHFDISRPFDRRTHRSN